MVESQGRGVASGWRCPRKFCRGCEPDEGRLGEGPDTSGETAEKKAQEVGRVAFGSEA